MKIVDFIHFILLAALWGASFLFMRVAAPEFGVIPLVFLRVFTAALLLLPLVVWQNNLAALTDRVGPMFFLGLVNSALPFCLFAFATLTVTAGFTSILNSTAPLWGAVVAFLWFGQRLSLSAVIGLFIGFVGVLILLWDKVSVGAGVSVVPVLAGLVATLCYAIAANYTKHYLSQVNPLLLSTGSLIAASLLSAPLAYIYWPQQAVSVQSWLAVIALGLFCTGLAYILYFRLIFKIGPTRAITVTFLIPVFGVMLGMVVLQEQITLLMLIGAAVVLFGTALSMGLIHFFGLRKNEGVI